MVSTQDVDTPEEDDDEPDRVAVMNPTYDHAMSHALKLKEYMLHYPNMYGMDVCNQIDEVCRMINTFRRFRGRSRLISQQHGVGCSPKYMM